MLPVRLEMENFLSHTHSVLDFDFSSALFVGAFDGDERKSNGAGKSAIFQAISFALHSQTRHKTADDVVKRGQTVGKVEFTFIQDEHKYIIIRTRNVRTGRTDVILRRINEDGTTEDLTADTTSMTNALIRDIIKSNYDVFINSSYFQQNFGFDFAEGTFSSRQSLISSLLNLSKWNDYQLSSKEEFKSWSLRVDALKAKVEQKKSLEESLSKTEKQLEEVVEQSKDLQQEEIKLTAEIRLLEDKARDNKDTLNKMYEYKKVWNDVENCRDILSKQKESVVRQNRALDNLVSEIADTETKINDLDREIQDLQQLVSIELDLDIHAMEASLLEGKAKLNSVSGQIKNLQENDECVLCGHEWDDPVVKKSEIERRETYIEDLKTHIHNAVEQLNSAKKQQDDCQKAKFALDHRIDKQSKLHKSIKYLNLQKQNAVKEIQDSQDRVASLSQQLNDLEKQKDALDQVEGSDVADTSKVLASRIKELDRVKKDIYTLSFTQGSLTQEIKGFATSIEELYNVQEELRLAQRKATVYGKLTKAFSRDGVQAIIIDNVIEDITRVANQWLADFCLEPTQISFLTQKKNTKGEWRETLEIEIHTPSGISKFESLSGGEKFRVGFAIRLALSMLQARRMGGEVQALFLDEVSSSLDPAGLETFVSIIRKLEREMKILLITHDDKLKDEFDTVITVRRTAEGSRIER